jgi:hypothetical protein
MSGTQEAKCNMYTKPNPPEMCVIVGIFATWAMRATRIDLIMPPY